AALRLTLEARVMLGSFASSGNRCLFLISPRVRLCFEPGAFLGVSLDQRGAVRFGLGRGTRLSEMLRFTLGIGPRAGRDRELFLGAPTTLSRGDGFGFNFEARAFLR